ncbi:hypothetical protein H6G27_33280 [Nostoc linckia FACHB-104]|nr:hypothetical protein [Nostoc linckia FACHB-104]
MPTAVNYAQLTITEKSPSVASQCGVTNLSRFVILMAIAKRCRQKPIAHHPPSLSLVAEAKSKI